MDSPGAEYISGAIESAGELGVSVIQGPWELSGRLRHLGPYPRLNQLDDLARAVEDVQRQTPIAAEMQRLLQETKEIRSEYVVGLGSATYGSLARRLLGGPGPDRLVGGPGRDVLLGGPGRDSQRQ